MGLSIDANSVHQPLPPPNAAAVGSGDGGQSGQDRAPGAAATVSAAYTIAPTAASQDQPSAGAVDGVQPNLNDDGARLMALHVQQALSAQTFSIANQSSQSILALFKA